MSAKSIKRIIKERNEKSEKITLALQMYSHMMLSRVQVNNIAGYEILPEHLDIYSEVTYNRLEMTDATFHQLASEKKKQLYGRN